MENKTDALLYFIENDEVIYNNQPLSADLKKIEEIVEALGFCRETISNTYDPIKRAQQEHLKNQLETKLKQTLSEIFTSNQDAKIVLRFLEARHSFYITQRDKERASGEEEGISSFVWGQLEATDISTDIVKDFIARGPLDNKEIEE